MTPPQGATPRPWLADGPVVRLPDDEEGFIADCLNPEDAAFIVYAVNHIEQAEAELAIATELLRDIHKVSSHLLVENGLQRIIELFLRRHDAQPGER